MRVMSVLWRRDVAGGARYARNVITDGYTRSGKKIRQVFIVMRVCDKFENVVKYAHTCICRKQMVEEVEKNDRECIRYFSFRSLFLVK